MPKSARDIRDVQKAIAIMIRLRMSPAHIGLAAVDKVSKFKTSTTPVSVDVRNYYIALASECHAMIEAIRRRCEILSLLLGEDIAKSTFDKLVFPRGRTSAAEAQAKADLESELAGAAMRDADAVQSAINRMLDKVKDGPPVVVPPGGPKWT